MATTIVRHWYVFLFTEKVEMEFFVRKIWMKIFPPPVSSVFCEKAVTSIASI